MRGNAIKAFGLERFGITPVAPTVLASLRTSMAVLSDAKTVQRAKLPGENSR